MHQKPLQQKGFRAVVRFHLCPSNVCAGRADLPRRDAMRRIRVRTRIGSLCRSVGRQHAPAPLEPTRINSELTGNSNSGRVSEPDDSPDARAGCDPTERQARTGSARIRPQTTHAVRLTHADATTRLRCRWQWRSTRARACPVDSAIRGVDLGDRHFCELCNDVIMRARDTDLAPLYHGPVRADKGRIVASGQRLRDGSRAACFVEDVCDRHHSPHNAQRPAPAPHG